MSNTQDSSKRRSNLSPAKLALFEKWKRGGASPTPETQTIPPRQCRTPVPLSYAQQRLWFLAQLEPESSFYNMPIAVRLSGRLNLEALERSLAEVIRRHESLRTSFSTLDEQPVQLIAPQVTLSLPLIDLSHLSHAEQATQLEQEATAEAGRGFDLREAPLLRVRMLRLAQDEHVLLLTMHHIITDAWSLEVLLREIAALYEAYERGEESPLEELEVQYGDYAVWQRERLKGEELERELRYWREQLRGAPAVLELPTDRVRPPVQTYRGGRQSVRVTSEVVSRLREVGQSEGATLYMVLLGAFSVLLWRYSGAEDVVVGTPVANRTRGEVEGLIGFFVNTLVMRVEVRGEESYRELVRRVREVSVGGYGHQEVPFEKVVEELTPERSLSHTPLFQVMFILQNAPMSSLKPGGITLSVLPSENYSAKFDLLLNLTETAQGLVGTFEYSTDLFDSTTIKRMSQHLEQLLESISAEATQSVSELSLLGTEERTRLLAEYSGRENRRELTHQCLHELFEAQVARTPEAVAVVFEGCEMTYCELNMRANQVAHHLRGLGVVAEQRVGLVLERSVEMVVALLGVLKAGGAYVPLNIRNPMLRQEQIVSDSGIRVVLTQSRRRKLVPEAVAEVVCMDEIAFTSSHQSVESPETKVTGENLAYVLYTSGSTGQPKGVAMCHRALCNLILWQIENMPLRVGTKTLQLTPLSFDVSFQEIFSTWCAGGTLVLTPEALRRDLIGIMRFIADQEIERLFLPAISLQNLARIASDLELFPHKLRWVITAGEQLSLTSYILTLFEQLEGCSLYNQYGPTEAHVVTQYELSGAHVNWPTFPPIGRPIANMEAYVLDERMEPVGVGLRGELYLAGVGLARGYLHRPDLTAERFLPHPYSADRGARLYRTGDVVRYNERGELEYVGRADRQVKVRGYRIELGEVEAALREMEGVREAAVVVREEEGVGSGMVAYVAGGEELEIGEVRRKLKERLPEYMIPGRYVKVERLPVTSSGKVDRRALPEPEWGAEESRAEYEEARGEVEREIAGMWAEVLRKERVGIHDNFFELGGDSILGVRVIAKANRAGLPLEMKHLFLHQTVAELAAVAEKMTSGEV